MKEYLPIDPPAERYEYDTCPECKELFASYDALNGDAPEMCRAWWDIDYKTPFCCKECMDEYNAKNEWEYEEEMDALEVELLKREAAQHIKEKGL